MRSTTPSAVRSLLRLIPKRNTSIPSSSRGFAYSQCRAWSGAGSIRRVPLLPNGSERRLRWFSHSSQRGFASEKDKPPPSDLFHMPPPPSSHVDEKMVAEEKAHVPPTSHRGIVDHGNTPSPSPVQPDTPSSKANQTPPSASNLAEDPTVRVASSTEPSEPVSTSAPKSPPEDTENSTAASNPTRAQTSSLPSDTEKARWQLSKNTQKWMDDFLAKAAIFSQQLNTYTGTDYSGIEALRREIIELERQVKKLHGEIAVAKEAYAQAHTAQTASQKEVVGLLERKHSWAAGDLERYMSLIRSEHLNEQAVQRAKDDLASAERSLEDARSTLERKERKQYHEEQIWSDTIRRNSTWVTFGLMGLNIFLLLSNLALIEPWRRRRLVKEVRSALEENALATSASITAATAPAAMQAVERQIDEAVEPKGAKIEEVEAQPPEVAPNVVDGDDGRSRLGDELTGQQIPVSGEVLPDESVELILGNPHEPSLVETVKVVKRSDPSTLREELEERWAYWRAVFEDMFSDRQVTLKKVDLTSVALESAAAGIAIMGLFVLLFNPR